MTDPVHDPLPGDMGRWLFLAPAFPVGREVSAEGPGRDLGLVRGFTDAGVRLWTLAGDVDPVCRAFSSLVPIFRLVMALFVVAHVHNDISLSKTFKLRATLPPPLLEEEGTRQSRIRSFGTVAPPNPDHSIRIPEYGLPYTCGELLLHPERPVPDVAEESRRLQLPGLRVK